jgi:hypothetical protein
VVAAPRETLEADTGLASRRRPWLQPVLVGGAALAACTLVAVRDPNQEGSYGLCPFKAATGWDCPGCGLMRGAHALFTGDLVRAIDHNVFLPLVFGLMLFGYVRWFRRSMGHDVPRIETPSWLMLALAIVVFGFWVIRNLGGPFEYLASTAA